MPLETWKHSRGIVCLKSNKIVKKKKVFSRFDARIKRNN